MTVKELIEELKKYDEHLHVEICLGDYPTEFFDFEEVDVRYTDGYHALRIS
jgi:hypothetical protein